MNKRCGHKWVWESDIDYFSGWDEGQWICEKCKKVMSDDKQDSYSEYIIGLREKRESKNPKLKEQIIDLPKSFYGKD